MSKTRELVDTSDSETGSDAEVNSECCSFCDSCLLSGGEKGGKISTTVLCCIVYVRQLCITIHAHVNISEICLLV